MERAVLVEAGHYLVDGGLAAGLIQTPHLPQMLHFALNTITPIQRDVDQSVMRH